MRWLIAIALVAVGWGQFSAANFQAGEDLTLAPNHPDFRNRIRPCLRNYCQARWPVTSAAKRVLTFWVSPVRHNHCWVYQPEHDRLILWEPRVGEWYDDLKCSRRDLDLNSDVAPDPKGSTYVLSYQEAQQLVQGCLNGPQVLILQPPAARN